MANEAVIIELLGNGGDPFQVTVADGAGIEKGTLLVLSDPRTGAASSADGQLFLGVAAAEKVASDGQTTLAVYTNGIFDLKLTAATCAVGEMLKIAGANLVASADDDQIEKFTETVGYSLEAGAVSEVVAVKLRGF